MATLLILKDILKVINSKNLKCWNRRFTSKLLTQDAECGFAGGLSELVDGLEDILSAVLRLDVIDEQGHDILLKHDFATRVWHDLFPFVVPHDFGRWERIDMNIKSVIIQIYTSLRCLYM